MSIEIIKERLESYHCVTSLEEEFALREITQELVLSALSRFGFFKHAAFQGGTCLRILYGISRFSEDLDFILKKPDLHFNFEYYMNKIIAELQTYGYNPEITDRSKIPSPIKKIFIKDNSIGKVLDLNFSGIDLKRKKLRIKLEADSNPPAGSNFENRYCDFPYPFSVTVQDISSLFAGKIHALLCGDYSKARDWYDFSWYVSRKANVNYRFLKSALKQFGPWRNQEINIDTDWLISTLSEKIETTDWKQMKTEIKRFLKADKEHTVDVWSNEFFMDRAGFLQNHPSNPTGISNTSFE